MSYSDEFNSKAKINHLILSMSGDAEFAGLQSLNNVNKEKTSKNRKEKKEDERYFDFLQLLTEIQIKLQDFIDEIDVKLKKAKQDLQQHNGMLAERIALEHCIGVLDSDELLERNTDGSLKDENLERAIFRYLKDNNMCTDLSDDARIYAVAQNLIASYPAQEKLLEVIGLDKQIINTLESGKEQAQTLQYKFNNPDISKSEVKYISKRADNIKEETNEVHFALSVKRENILHIQQPQHLNNSDLDSVDSANNEYEKNDVLVLPSSTLNF